METEFIIIKELYENSQIEPSFIHLLADEGLLEVQIIEGEQYIHESKLYDLERFARWYYDLSINIEGIDVIQNLLNRMDAMKKELYQLRKLCNFENESWDTIK